MFPAEHRAARPRGRREPVPVYNHASCPDPERPADTPSDPRPVRRQAIRLALAFPFFLLPVPLTVAAPDVYAGYGLHLRVALAAAALGGGLALLNSDAGRRWTPRLGRWLVLLALTAMLATAATSIARGVDVVVVVLTGILSGAERWEPAPFLFNPWARLAVAALLLTMLARIDRADGLRRTLAAVIAVPAAGALSAALEVTLGWNAAACVLVVLAALAAALVRADGRRLELVTAAATVLGSTALLASVGALVTLSGSEGTGPEAASLGPLVLGAFVGALVGFAAWRWLPRLQRFVPHPFAVPRASWLPLMTALPLLGVAATSAALVGAALAALLVGSAEGGPDLPLGRGPLFVLIGLALLRQLVWAGSDPARRARARGVGASIWAVLVLAELGAALSDGLRGPGWLLAAAVALGSLFVRGPAWGARVGLLPAGVVVGPAALGLLLVNLAGLHLPGAAVVAVGALAGAVLVRTIEPRLLERVDDVGLASARLLLLLSGILPIFVGIAFGLSPAFVIGAAVALFVLPRLAGRPLALPIAAWMLFYVCFASVMVFKEGPSGGTCAKLQDDGATPLLRRHELGPVYRGTQPYDAHLLPGTDLLLVSFKRIDKTGGFVEARPLSDLSLLGRLDTKREGGALWPERFAQRPGRPEAIVQLIGAGAHAMWFLEARAGAAGAPPRIIHHQTIDIPWEPSNPVVDEARQRLVLSYVPNWNSNNPLLEVWDTDSGVATSRTPNPSYRVQMADYVALDSGSGNYWVPAMVDLLRFTVVEVAGEGLRPLRRLDPLHPSVGMAADSARDRILLTNPVAGTLELWRLSTLEHLQSVRVGRFPRDLEYDAGRGLVHVAAYGDGRATTLRLDGGRLDVVRRTSVGPLFRGLGLDRDSGRLFAATGCGVFELEAGP